MLGGHCNGSHLLFLRATTNSSTPEGTTVPTSCGRGSQKGACSAATEQRSGCEDCLFLPAPKQHCPNEPLVLKNVIGRDGHDFHDRENLSRRCLLLTDSNPNFSEGATAQIWAAAGPFLLGIGACVCNPVIAQGSPLRRQCDELNVWFDVTAHYRHPLRITFSHA